MSEDALMTKSICEGFDLIIMKSLPALVIEFHLHNTTDFIFLFTLNFTDVVGLNLRDSALEQRVTVSPQCTFKLCEFDIEGSFSYKYQYSYQKLNPDPQLKTVHINEDLTLNIMQDDLQQLITFELSNDRSEIVEFELTFHEMTHIQEAADGQMVHSVDVLPRTAVKVCELKFDGEWNYKYSTKHTVLPEVIDVYTLQQELNRQVMETRQLLYRIPIDFVSIAYIASILQSCKFTDPFFPPAYTSVSDSFPGEVQWKRPEEFVEGQFQLFPKNLTGMAVVAGKVKCSWLMCALCVLSSYPARCQALLANTEVNPQGIYRFVLYKNGQKVSVVIDDYIPCYPGGPPIFSSTAGSELWVLLLEKAYAKLHGNYERLNHCTGLDGLIDLTGCPTYSFRTVEIADIWVAMNKWSNEGWGIIGVAGNLDTGAEEYYYLVSSVNIVREYKIVKLTNSWGNAELLAQWSQNSDNWTEDMRSALAETYDQEEGSFWIEINDLHRIFHSIFICKIREYNEMRANTVILNTGIPRESLKIELEEECSVIIGVHQEDPAVIGADIYRKPIDLGICIYKSNETGLEFCASTDANKVNRQVYLEGGLGPGTYFAIPISTALNLSETESERIVNPLLTPQATLHPYFKHTLNDLFRRICKSPTSELLYDDFAYIDSQLELRITEETFVSSILNKYASSNGLVFQGLCEFFLEEIEKKGENTVREWISRLGYDEYMHSIESKPIEITCQSQGRFSSSLETLPIETIQAAVVANIERKGVTTSQEEEILIKALSHTTAVSFIAVNLTSSPLNIQVDFSAARVSGKLVETQLGPYEKRVFQHMKTEGIPGYIPEYILSFSRI